MTFYYFKKIFSQTDINFYFNLHINITRSEKKTWFYIKYIYIENMREGG